MKKSEIWQQPISKKWTECSSKGPSNPACIVFLNVPFLLWKQPFWWKTTVIWWINNKAFNNWICLCFGEKWSWRNLCAMKLNFSPPRKEHSFLHRKDFLPLTSLVAKVHAHHQLGYVPHFHTIWDKQLRNVKCLTLGDKAGVGAVL